jgi:preprotein translocase subunit SecA
MFKWLNNLVDSNEKVLKGLLPIVTKINELEPEFQKLTADELKAKTQQFRDRFTKATADAENRADNARQELQEVRKGVAEAHGKYYTNGSGELAGKQLQEQLELFEKELIKAQKDALDELIPEAFAAVREASNRSIGRRHFDVQLLGGIVLQQGQIAEIKNGEGSTLVAALPLYLNSLKSKGVHFVAINDYIAKTSAYNVGPVYDVLGVSVASIQGQEAIGDQNGASFFYDTLFDSGKQVDQWRHFRPVTRKEAYLANIVYGSNLEFGLDYLRDNMVVDLNQIVQRDLNYAIIDEVDNILIDNAQTPIIISSPGGNSTMQKYILADKVVRQLSGIITDVGDNEAKQNGIGTENDVDYFIDKKSKTIRLTQRGILQIQNKLNLENLREFQLNWEHFIRQAIIAHQLYKKNREYVINMGKVVIVDEFTGHIIFGRRYPRGLHQAIEAKEMANGERVQVEEETRIYATITFQNYFRLYHKLAGMTGTAITEAEELHRFYNLEVVAIPTNKPMLRQDSIDKIYKNEQAKFNQIVKEVEKLHKEGRPILIGTVSVEKSEMVSDMLMRKGIRHEVLNAKLHEKEAYIVAQAGRLGAVTVATNMVGRGRDIVLGGNPGGRDLKEWQKEHDEVVQKGGLNIIGMERHEARRFDNQLRSLAGIHGDPGSTRFYVSMEDDIIRQFGGDSVGKFIEWAGLGEDVPIENSIVNRTVENAQIGAEVYRTDLRKHQSLYEDVLNDQRKIIYDERRKILSGMGLKTNVLSMIGEEILEILQCQISEPAERIIAEIKTILPLPKEFNEKSLKILDPNEIKDRLMLIVEAFYKSRERELGVGDMRMLEKLLFLRIIDLYWVDHLANMDNARQNIGLHVISQGNPLAVYKHGAYELFEGMMKGVRHDFVRNIFNCNLAKLSGNVSIVRLS